MTPWRNRHSRLIIIPVSPSPASPSVIPAPPHRHSREGGNPGTSQQRTNALQNKMGARALPASPFRHSRENGNPSPLSATAMHPRPLPAWKSLSLSVIPVKTGIQEPHNREPTPFKTMWAHAPFPRRRESIPPAATATRPRPRPVWKAFPFPVIPVKTGIHPPGGDCHAPKAPTCLESLPTPLIIPEGARKP